jgi:hypothetical protein
MGQKRGTIPVSHAENRSKDSKWLPPSLSLIIPESWGNTQKDNGSG